MKPLKGGCHEGTCHRPRAGLFSSSDEGSTASFFHFKSWNKLCRRRAARRRGTCLEVGASMNPYRKLLSNTALFGVSTFGARFLTFLLTPLYTRVLSSAEYGVTDLVIQTGNLVTETL